MAIALIVGVIAILWLGAVIVLLIRTEKYKHNFALFISIIATCLSWMLMTINTEGVLYWLSWGNGFGNLSFSVDALSLSLALIATTIASLCVLYSRNYMNGNPQLGRYYALILFFVGSMVGLAVSNSFLLLFFFWELTALCSYALISFDSDSPKAVIGGLRALVITQVGGIGLLFAGLLIYAQGGNYDINQFLQESANYPEDLRNILAFAILIAAAAKSAQVPFHTWLGGAMEAPSPVSALIHAATMVNAGVYILMRLYPAFAIVPTWRETVMVVGILSALLAGLFALTTNDIKRVLAYSTVSQLGYMFCAVGLGAIAAAQIHLLSHAFFKALLFLSAGTIIHNLGTRDMRQMGGLWKQMPFVCTVMLIGVAGLVGIPFANGFWSKELILEAAIETNSISFIVMLFGIAITASYSLRMLILLLRGDPRSAPVHKTGHAMSWALGILAIGVLGSWLFNAGLSQWLDISLLHHDIHAITTSELVADILLNPVSYFTLLVVAIGGLLVWFRQPFLKYFAPLNNVLEGELGFSRLNDTIVRLTESISIYLGRSQTGILNWNLLAILATFLLILLVLKGANS